MTYIDLPRAVEAYFAFAELPATERGRHFTITFSYFEAERLDRLQWWWQVSKAQERAGDAMVQSLRQEAILRFRQHIERWLVNSRRCLRGGEPFPQLEALAGIEEPATGGPPAAETKKESGYVETLREYARIAAGR
ncbi:MAG: hypothetical protein ABIP38_02290 [Steroidobacteraceae bacterium]